MSGTLEYVEESLSFYYNKILPLDHRLYAVDFNINEHFNDNISKWWEIYHVKLNPLKGSYRAMLTKELGI